MEPLPPARLKKTGEAVQKPVIVHRDVILRRPEHASAEQGVDWGTQLYFDGGSQQREGTGGYVVWDTRGALRASVGRWYGAEAPTNNTAEVRALVEGLTFVHTTLQHHPSALFVHGDSKLTIDFCRRTARPSRPELFIDIRRV